MKTTFSLKYSVSYCRFNGVYSRNNLPKRIKDEAYVTDLDEDADVSTNWIILYVKNIEIIYFGSSGAEHVLKEIKTFIRHKNIKTKVFRIRENDSIMCGYFCIGFIGFMFASKTLIDYTSLFSPCYFEKMII